MRFRRPKPLISPRRRGATEKNKGQSKLIASSEHHDFSQTSSDVHVPGVFSVPLCLRVGFSSDQNTVLAGCCCLPARRKRGSAGALLRILALRYSPIAGPCLKPWPDPPPASQTLSNPGWRSIRKSPFHVFSYWQTRVSTTGAPAKSGTCSFR